MSTIEPTTKDRLLQATRDMLMEGVDASDLSSRQIARRAGVGPALINYYFQTKENLIAQAIEATINSLASAAEVTSREAGLSPHERIKQRGREIAGFIMRYPAMAKIAMLQALTHPHQHDSLAHVARLLEKNLREHYGDRKNDWQITILAMQIMAPLQLLFLRSQAANGHDGFDLQNDAQRNAFMDELIANLLPPLPLNPP